ncbi:hypothetical protein AB0L22_09395 [Micromonospora haikouensis]|uniref:hypothetical protein n=1 Tax=Micromonospora haikouensis TaxID=686309 RepID=UPI00342288F5
MEFEELGVWTSVASAAIALGAGVLALLGWRTAAGARRDQAAAEEQRRRREMRPELEVTVDLPSAADSGLLTVKLVGPREVERYDWIRVQVRNDKDRVFPGTHHGYSEEEWRRQVWGPVWFRPGIDGCSGDKSIAEQGGKVVTDVWLFRVDRTLAPSWYSGGDAAWRKDYAGEPIRLRIEIGLGERSWVELALVPLPPRSAYEDGGLMVV